MRACLYCKNTTVLEERCPDVENLAYNPVIVSNISFIPNLKLYVDLFFVCVFLAELSRRNSEETLNITTVSKKSVVVLKKELTEKTEALNAALKRENQLKVSFMSYECVDLCVSTYETFRITVCVCDRFL